MTYLSEFFSTPGLAPCQPKCLLCDEFFIALTLKLFWVTALVKSFCKIILEEPLVFPAHHRPGPLLSSFLGGKTPDKKQPEVFGQMLEPGSLGPQMPEPGSLTTNFYYIKYSSAVYYTCLVTRHIC